MIFTVNWPILPRTSVGRGLMRAKAASLQASSGSLPAEFEIVDGCSELSVLLKVKEAIGLSVRSPLP